MIYRFSITGDINKLDPVSDLFSYTEKRFDELFNAELAFNPRQIKVTALVRSEKELTQKILDRIYFFLEDAFSKKYKNVIVKQI